MRECPNCESLIDQGLFVCPNCQAPDYGWAEHFETFDDNTKRKFHRKTIYVEGLKTHSSSSVKDYKIRLSTFSDSGELGFHLFRIKQLLAGNKYNKVRVILNTASWGYDWDYAYDWDPERDIYLPPSLPLPALVEVSRFIHALLSLNSLELETHLVLPPKTHAATTFINGTGLFSALPTPKITYANHALEPSYPQDVMMCLFR